MRLNNWNFMILVTLLLTVTVLGKMKDETNGMPIKNLSD